MWGHTKWGHTRTESSLPHRATGVTTNQEQQLLWETWNHYVMTESLNERILKSPFQQKSFCDSVPATKSLHDTEQFKLSMCVLPLNCFNCLKANIKKNKDLHWKKKYFGNQRAYWHISKDFFLFEDWQAFNLAIQLNLVYGKTSLKWVLWVWEILFHRKSTFSTFSVLFN